VSVDNYILMRHARLSLLNGHTARGSIVEEALGDWLNELRHMPYREYLRSTAWSDTREVMLLEAENRCQLCDSDRRLQVHHRTYERRGAELLSDLIVLCRECHARHHGKLADPPAPRSHLDELPSLQEAHRILGRPPGFVLAEGVA
jgi:5-methylcytosine-specific restriction endonuclease McrA